MPTRNPTGSRADRASGPSRPSSSRLPPRDSAALKFASPVCGSEVWCCDDRIECLAAGAHDEFPYALLWIVIPGGVKGAVAGIEVVVSVQHQVGLYS